jgi:putative transcriptional regulator
MLKNNIKFYREEKKLTQLELAEMLGVSNDWISRIERGASEPGFKLVRKLSTVLEQDILDLFYEG